MSKKKKAKHSPTYSAPALEKGLDILELLAGAERGSTLSEVALALGRTRNEIFRMLTCLEERGYIARKQGDDRYQVTARLFELAHRHPPTHELLAGALPVMRSLASKAHQSCQMGIQHEGSVLIIAQTDAPGLIGIAVRVGARRELLNSASGFILLASQDPDLRADWLAAAGASRWTPQSKSSLERRLQAIQRRGYEEHPNPVVKTVIDVSSPIRDHDGHTLASLTVPFMQMSGSHPSLPQVRRMLMEAAAEISREMGGVAPPAKRGRAKSRLAPAR